MIKERIDLLPRITREYSSAGIEPEEVNIIGIRFSADQHKDIWNDLIGIWIPNTAVYLWPGTTDPGRKATLSRDGGAAHLCEGYHKDIWVLDKHPRTESNFQHAALCDRPEFGTRAYTIWRDVNRDYNNNDKTIQTGHFGINCHRASLYQDVPYIGPYGEGCQVTLNAQDFDFFLSVLGQSEKCKQTPKCLWSYYLFTHYELGL